MTQPKYPSRRARDLFKAIRKLDKRRRREALEGLWRHAEVKSNRWPEPGRLYDMVIDNGASRVWFRRKSEAEAAEMESLVESIRAARAAEQSP